MEQYLNTAKEIVEESARVSQGLLGGFAPQDEAALVKAREQAYQTLIEKIGTRYPRHTIAMPRQILEGKDQEFTWMITLSQSTDPFENQYVGVGLTHHNQPIVSVIWVPEGQRKYSAAIYHGAQCEKDGKNSVLRIRDDALTAKLNVKFAPKSLTEDEIRRIQSMLKEGTCSEEFSPFVLNLLDIAEGKTDVFYTNKSVYAIDLCIAGLIAQEAGVSLVQSTGEEIRIAKNLPEINGVIAVNRKISTQTLARKIKQILERR